jgi:hypothetical protein
VHFRPDRHTAALLCERHAGRLQPFLLTAAADQRRTQQHQRRRRPHRTPVVGGGGRWTGSSGPAGRHRQRQRRRQAALRPGRAERLLRAAEFEEATQLERLLRVGLLTAVLLLLSRFLRGDAAAAILKKRTGGGGYERQNTPVIAVPMIYQLCVVRTMLN